MDHSLLQCNIYQVYIRVVEAIGCGCLPKTIHLTSQFKKWASTKIASFPANFQTRYMFRLCGHRPARNWGWTQAGVGLWLSNVFRYI